MLLTLSNWQVSSNTLSLPSLTVRKDNEVLLGDFFNQIFDKYLAEITPSSIDQFSFELFSNDSSQYDKLRIDESTITSLPDRIYYRYLLDFIGYDINFSLINSLGLSSLLSYSNSDNRIRINRANLYSFGNNLEDIILSVLLAIAPFTNSVGIVYLGKFQINTTISDRFSIEIKSSRSSANIFNPNDIV